MKRTSILIRQTSKIIKLFFLLIQLNRPIKVMKNRLPIVPRTITMRQNNQNLDVCTETTELANQSDKKRR